MYLIDIMSKFSKRLTKTFGKPFQNALVIGEGFGFMENIIGMFQTVFVINDTPPTTKYRNLVYKENYEDLHLLVDISVVFFDLKKINDINLTTPVFTRWKSMVVVEGNDPISRDFTQSFYNNGWRCTSQQGFFHAWEIK